MRVEKMRKLIWGINVALGLGLAWYGWTLFMSKPPPYVLVEDLTVTSGRDERAPALEEEKQKSWYAVLHDVPISGPRPPPEMDLGPAEEAPEVHTGPLAQLVELISTRRFTESRDGRTTDESSALFLLKKEGREPVWLRIGDTIPNTGWKFVDIVLAEPEDGEGEEVPGGGEVERAVFVATEGEEAGKPYSIPMVTREIPSAAGPGPSGPLAGGGDGSSAGDGAGEGASPDALLDRLPEFDESARTFPVRRRERETLSRERFQERELAKVVSGPWKNPDTGRYEGLQVKKIERKSYAYRRGVREGDIILSVNGHPVSGRAGVMRYLKSEEGQGHKQYVVKMRTSTGAEKQLVYNVED